MTDEVRQPVAADPWGALRGLTQARIGLGRVGASLPTARHLEFQLAHAQARDAVQAALDADALASAFAMSGLRVVHVRSQASDLATHLRRPDLGRRLDPVHGATITSESAVDLALVVAGGLSATAVNRHAGPLLAALLPLLPPAWVVAPVTLIEYGRVAIGDEVGERLRARLAVVLIGERPGLSAPDSLGIYVTWAPRVGLTDEARHCISNVRPEGLDPPEAARRLAHLLLDARREGCTGIALNARLQSRSAALAPGMPPAITGGAA